MEGKGKRIARHSTVVEEYEAMRTNLRDEILEQLRETAINPDLESEREKLQAKEIELLKRELDLLKQAQVGERCASGSGVVAAQMQESCVGSTAHFSFRDVEESMQEFSGEDGYRIQNWLNDFEQTAAVVGWNNLQQFVYAKRLLKGKAKLALRGAERISSFDELKNLLLEEFTSKESAADIHMRLAQRKKKPGESYLEFFLTIKEIAKGAHLDDISIIRYTIDGIQDDEIYKSVLYGAKSLSEFRERLDIYAQIKKKRRQCVPLKSSAQTGRKNESNTLKCFNCGEQGHKSVNCKNKPLGPKCFHCDNFGHKAFECPKRNVAKKKYDDARKEVSLVEKALLRDDFMNIMVKINGISVNAYIDTGSDLSLIKEETLHNFGEPNL